jgi:hypothetical protein
MKTHILAMPLQVKVAKSYYLLFASIILFSFQNQSFAQKIKGKITDESKQGIPFVSVYVEGTTIGTTSNAEGQYFLELDNGSYTIVFRHLGYETQTKQISMSGKDIEINIEMKMQTVQLKEVTVSSKDEDPAYAIIRQAQAKRKFYLNQVSKYEANVYMKASYYVKNAPKKILGKEIVIVGLDKDRNGIVYLSESMSKYYYQAPNKSKEIMLSSKVSGTEIGFSWNRADNLNWNFYESSINSIGDRNFISPIAPTAMLYYKYKLIGEYQDKGVKVNKIQVTPRTKGAPLYHGFIHIQEDTWRIHSTDLYLTGDSGIDYLDTARIKQIFVPVTDSVWMKSTQVFDFKFSIGALGIKVQGGGTYMGVFSNYVLEPKFYSTQLSTINNNQSKNEQLTTKNKQLTTNNRQKKQQPTTNNQQQTATNQQSKKQEERIKKQEEKEAKKFFGSEVQIIQKDANKRSESYWDSIRPVPLTELEIKDYRLKDSIKSIKDSRTYKDSIDKINNKFKPINMLTGYYHRNTYRKTSWAIDPPINNIQFNTVEGWVGELSGRWTFYNDTTYKRTNINGAVRYGLSSENLYGKLGFSHRWNLIKRNNFSFEAGHYVSQFNANEPITFLQNTMYSLWAEQNFMKIYEKSYVNIDYFQEVANGLFGRINVEFAQRNPLQNAENLPTQFRVNRQDREFTSNDPLNPDNNGNSFEAHNAVVIGLGFTYRPAQKYMTRPNMKAILRSPYPTLGFLYRKGMGGTDFDFVRLSVYDDVNIGIVGSSSYDLSVGGFLNKNKVQFMDYKHFMTTQVFFAPSTFRSFWNLPYYTYSTTDTYFEGHFEHHFNGFLTNSIPLFKRLNWHLVGGAHVLYTDQSKEYIELTVGLEKIFKILRVDFVSSYRRGQAVGTAFRFRIGFN